MKTPNSSWMVNSANFSAVLQVAEALGASREKIQKVVGLSQAQLADAEGFYPFNSFLELYDLACAESGVQDIGLYTGRVNYINRLNIQLYVVKFCKTFRDFLNLMPSLLNIAGDIGEMSVLRKDDLIRLAWTPLCEQTKKIRYFSDEMLVMTAMIANSLCIRPISILRAEFTYSHPKDCTALEESFGKNLNFDCEVSALYYHRTCLDYPLTRMDAEWMPEPTTAISSFFGQEKTVVSFLDQVRQVVVRLMPAGKVTIEPVAGELNISVRTLQRRLLEKKTQFQILLKDVRSEMAVNYLSDARLSITDVAFLLGYNDQRSFSGAFKQWHNMSPSEFRSLSA